MCLMIWRFFRGAILSTYSHVDPVSICPVFSVVLSHCVGVRGMWFHQFELQFIRFFSTQALAIFWYPRKLILLLLWSCLHSHVTQIRCILIWAISNFFVDPPLYTVFKTSTTANSPPSSFYPPPHLFSFVSSVFPICGDLSPCPNFSSAFTTTAHLRISESSNGQFPCIYKPLILRGTNRNAPNCTVPIRLIAFAHLEVFWLNSICTRHARKIQYFWACWLLLFEFRRSHNKEIEFRTREILLYFVVVLVEQFKIKTGRFQNGGILVLRLYFSSFILDPQC